MKEEKLGTIVNEGKMINLDTSSIEDLEELSKKLKIRKDDLKKKVVTVFKQ